MTCAERSAIDAHLAQCPLCRQALDDVRGIVRGLARCERPAAPPGLAASISRQITIERAARTAQPARSLPARCEQWIEQRLMPYLVGAFASLLLFTAVMSALRQQLLMLRDLTASARSAEFVWVVGESGYDVTRPVSPEGYAAMRTPYAAQSPSLNPRGALAELAWTPASGRPDDDDMIVVADVYGNGSASLAAVVEPPRNPRMLDELQDALRKNPAFVPASLDRRPQTMRVVFVMQKMQVDERGF